MSRPDRTRREFLTDAARLAAGAAGGLYAGAQLVRARPALGAPRAVSMPRPARVGLAVDPRPPSARAHIDPAVVTTLLEQALVRATGAADGVGALLGLFSPADVVGIKVNCLAGRGLSTHLELVQALIAKLMQAGISASQIVVWDRADADLRRARYPVERRGPGPFFFGTNDDYENNPIDAGSVGGCLSRILTRRTTAVINVPVLKDHDLAGISGALKSFYGAIHNPNKYHDHGCSPYVADLNAYPLIRQKARLVIFDALSPQFERGPAWVPEYTWPLGAIFAATDPVAADAVALKIIADKRRAAGLESLEKAGRAPLWLEQAARLGLGVADLARIEEVRS